MGGFKIKTFDILGLSHGYVSMLIDTLVKLHGNNIRVRIIKNLKSDTKQNMPYTLPGIECTELWHHEWKSPSENILLGVGKVDSRLAVYNFFNKNYSIDINRYSNLIHPRADLAFSVKLGKGIFCNSEASIAPFVSIGNLVTINRIAGIGHHTKISDFCIINPNVHIAGRCNIGESTTIGMGGRILEDINIGRNTVIGAGSIVIKDIPDNVVAYGTPAKIIRENG